MRWCLLSDYPAHISLEELGNQLLILKMRTGDMDDECDECSLETWADAEKFSNGKKNLLRFPSRHFRGSFAHLSHFWFVTMLFLRRRFLQQKLSLLSWEPVLRPDIHFPQFWRHYSTSTSEIDVWNTMLDLKPKIIVKFWVKTLGLENFVEGWKQILYNCNIHCTLWVNFLLFTGNKDDIKWSTL